MSKLISVEEIRAELEKNPKSVYYIPKGRILSPSARDYLNRNVIPFYSEANRSEVNKALNNMPKKQEQLSPHYVDYKTGTMHKTKPEAMTHIRENKLVLKDDPVIVFRGKLDYTQAQIVFLQSMIYECCGCEVLIRDLEEILGILRKIMQAEVLNLPCEIDTILGLSFDEIRTQSHDPEKYFGIKVMTLPSYSMGSEFAGLNLLRTEIRQLELVAVAAFCNGKKIEHADIIKILNRLSSAVHIMMCRYLKGDVYKHTKDAKI
ncbi:MAG: ATP-binding protein [Ruminococcaceae bacterium]|nr:ATP-binding protein [Oscillospiraceae bacterium]